MSYSDKEVAENIGLGSMGELAGTFSFYKDRAPNLYALLACHPSISEGQRKIVIDSRGTNVKDNLLNVDRTSLNITIGHNGSAVKYRSEDFIAIRDRISEQLGITIKQVA